MTYRFEIPPFIDDDGNMLVRGTAAWDARELIREKTGCRLLSYGTLERSIATKGQSSKGRLTSGNIKKSREEKLLR